MLDESLKSGFCIVTLFETTAFWPAESVVARVTRYVPPAENVWLAGLPVTDPPSPKFQVKLYGETPPLAVAVKETEAPADGFDGENVKPVESDDAIVIVFEAVAKLPFASVTFSVTVYVPKVEYAWFAGLPDPVVPSPKFHLNEYGVAPPVAVPVNVTVCPRAGFVGVHEMPAASDDVGVNLHALSG